LGPVDAGFDGTVVAPWHSRISGGFKGSHKRFAALFFKAARKIHATLSGS
jgi:hypothetical protein